MELVFGVFTIGTIALLAAISPGPDFAVVAKNSLLHSRAVGIFTAIGVGLGILVHVAYSLLGIGLIISQSILLFSVIKWIGATYLVYLGIQLLRSEAKSAKQITEHEKTAGHGKKPNYAALREGFFTNALNPKATLFFLSVFTQVVGPSTPLFIQLLYGLEVAAIVLLWFVSLTLILTTAPARLLFRRAQRWVGRIMGGILIALGIKVALSTND